MRTLKEKIDKICLEFGVRSNYPEKFKEALKMLVVEECGKLVKGEKFNPYPDTSIH